MTPGMSLLLRLSETPAGAPTSPFEVNFGLFFWTWLVFLALLGLMYKFAWPQIIGSVEAREKRLADQLAETARLQEEAKKLVEQNQKALADARSQATALLAEAKAEADRDRAASVERTKAEQDELLARARREIATERDRAIGELRSEAVDLSLAAASKLVGERLDSEADRKLVTGYLSSLGEKH